jgi:xanthine phosphoribosyltransferase
MQGNKGQSMFVANHHYLSWDAVHRDTITLAHQIKDKGSWKKIVAVTRGGLIPTAILVQYLDIRLIDTVCIATYSAKNQPGRAEIFKTLYDESDQILVVDDLVDTGKTFEVLRGFLPQATYVSLYYKPKGKQWLDFAVKMIAQDVWVVFPWEKTADNSYI